MAGTPILIVVGGLPVTGKSTVASALVRQTGFTYLRVDRIERTTCSTGQTSGGTRPGRPLQSHRLDPRLAGIIGATGSRVNPPVSRFRFPRMPISPPRPALYPNPPPRSRQ